MTVLDAKPIRRRSLHDELTDRLRDLIAEGEIAPGEKISEKALCDRFDVSRTPLREALKVLAKEGLVTLTLHRGATVTPITRDDLAEAFPIMGALEALAGELACARATKAEVNRIAQLHARMRAHYEARERPEYFRLNQEIHGAIAAAARNPTLDQMQKSLSGRVRRARYLANVTQERWDQAMDEHDEILEALQARDAERLARLLKQHLEHKMQAVTAALEAEERAAEKRAAKARVARARRAV